MTDVAGVLRIHHSPCDRDAHCVCHRHFGDALLSAKPEPAFHHSDPARRFPDTELRPAGGSALHLRGESAQRFGDHRAVAGLGERPGRTHARLAGPGERHPLHPYRRGFRFVYRRCRHGIADARPGDDQEGVFQRIYLCGERLDVADHADHPPGHRVYPVRHPRPSVHRAALCRRPGAGGWC